VIGDPTAEAKPTSKSLPAEITEEKPEVAEKKLEIKLNHQLPFATFTLQLPNYQVTQLPNSYV
jgi:hypothetical protein